MFESEVSQKKKVFLFILLIILNIVLRIPSIPHEKGEDSFFIHSLANSITSYGHANWWIHWLSIFGYYPYSYASAIPFSLSGISQITGIELEGAILILCVLLGLFSVFSVYILAGVLYDDFWFRYLMALVFSTSQSILYFSTWEISSRGPLIIFLPLYLYFLIKNIQFTKKVLLILLTVVFLFSVHHLAIIIIPIALTFIVIKLLSTIKNFKIKSTYLNLIYTMGLLAVLMLPFLGLVEVIGSKYTWIFEIIKTIIRYIGPISIFYFSGTVYLITKKDKKTNIWFFLIVALLFAPFIYDTIYGIYMVQLYIIFFATVGLRNLLYQKSIKSSKIIGVTIIAVLMSSIMFSAFYNHYRTGENKDIWYMDEKTYTTGEWIDHNVNKDKHVFFSSENNYYVRCVALQKNGSSIVIGGPEGLTYGFIDKNSTENLQKVSITNSYYYTEGPYQTIDRDKFRSYLWYLENKDVSVIKKVYNLDYLVHSLTSPPPSGLYAGENEKIFSNGLLEIYNLRYY